MKKIILFPVCLMFIVAHTQNIDLGKNLVLYLQLNENLKEGSSNNFTVDTIGNPLFTSGKYNHSLEFDGVDDYLKITHDSMLSFGSEDFTVAFWVNKKVVSSSWNHSFAVNKWHHGSSGTNNEWSFSLTDNGSNNRPSFSIRTTDSTYTVKASGEISLNTWNHILGVKTSSNIKLYLNGILQDSVQLFQSQIPSTNLDLLVAANNRDTPRKFTNAAFDEILIYKKAFNQEEVTELYNNGVTCQNSNLCLNELAINTLFLPTDYKFAVKGKIITEEIKVQLLSSWPDYVFQDEYELKPLQDLKDFIKKNNHLPDIPSAKEVKSNGVDLGEMNMKLLKKIEELTLYLIEQNDQLKKQSLEINNLKREIEALKKQKNKSFKWED